MRTLRKAPHYYRRATLERITAMPPMMSDRQRVITGPPVRLRYFAITLMILRDIGASAAMPSASVIVITSARRMTEMSQHGTHLLIIDDDFASLLSRPSFAIERYIITQLRMAKAFATR